MRNYRRKVREKIIQMLGGVCVYCRCDDFYALEINHIKGQGTKESRNRKGGYSSTNLLMDIHMGRRGTDDLELTCGVCNAWHRLVKLNGVHDGWTITYNPATIS